MKILKRTKVRARGGTRGKAIAFLCVRRSRKIEIRFYELWLVSIDRTGRRKEPIYPTKHPGYRASDRKVNKSLVFLLFAARGAGSIDKSTSIWSPREHQLQDLPFDINLLAAGNVISRMIGDLTVVRGVTRKTGEQEEQRGKGRPPVEQLSAA